MASNNATSNEFFSMGSEVSCVTYLGEKITGEVIAFDYQTKTLVLKHPSTSGKANTNNISLLNLSNVSDIKVLKEGADQDFELCAISHTKLRKRLNQEIQAKVNMAQGSSMGVTPDGLKVFAFIFKTIEQCRWNDKSILVMDEVLINPPYRSEDCIAKDGKEAKALDHVRKIVEKYHKDHGNIRQVQAT
ncbi:protein LSM12 homolog A-like [Styela clava]